MRLNAPLSLFVLLFLSAGFPAFAQRAAEVELSFTEPVSSSEKMPIPLQDVEPFLAYSLSWQSAGSQVAIRFGDDRRWNTDWLEVLPDEHADPAAGRVIGRLGFAAREHRYFQVRYAGESDEQLRLRFFSPGSAEPGPDQRVKPTEKSLTCPCEQPEYVARAGWCLVGCPPSPNPTTTNVTHLIVHHSAGTNTAESWAAVVRSIWDFHVNFNGWADIGYNWLVDPNGVIYEGRGDDILGAHFCGSNTNTMGVCVLGDFTAIQPAPEALSSLQKLLAWKTCDIGADPLGFSFHSSSAAMLAHISGHRDGCATACPGDQFYPLLPVVRLSVADYINTSCSGLPGPTTLVVDDFTETTVLLSWTDNADGETGFELERSIDQADNFTLLGSLPANTTNYLDETVNPGSTYFYRVRAVDESGASDYSNIAEAVTLVSATQEDPVFRNLNLAPNPAGELVHLRMENELRGRFRAALLSVPDGRSLRSWTFVKEGELSLEALSLQGLPAGVYLLRLEHPAGSVALRVVRR